jgi:diketogulonate reductase-like aldo/keto reductase
MTQSAAKVLGKNYRTVPKLLYGTAWKKERTEELVYQALKAGFRGVDTAAQPRHYQEDLVGKGIKRAITDGIIDRNDLFVS